jgi:hypothetical protein
MRIPYAALRFSGKNKLGVLISQKTIPKNTLGTLLIQNLELSQQTGILEGIANIKPPTRLF